MKSTYIIFLSCIMLLSCNTYQSKLDEVVTIIDYAEQSNKEMSSEDWSKLETLMNELKNDLEQNRDKYSEAQLKEFGKIQGRYSALILKKRINDFQESIKDFGNQIDGFMEGLNND